ncbi:MAG TPA: hypothetical protein VNA25_24235, partial [Phycisphaerae bacterium]|nr:hypothetical protein [Phycisphaerae bacterium]
MRRYVRDVIGGAFALYLGKTKAFHDARARALSGDAILSVYFHDPTRRIFEGCVQWLGENGFKFLSAEELQEILSSQRRPPGPSVWLSIDDAWRGNLENVVPVVRRHRIPITLFIPVGPVEDNGVLWWSHIRRHRQHLPDEFRQDYEKFWHVPEKVRRRIVQELMEAFPFKGPREVLTIQELKEIA